MNFAKLKLSVEITFISRQKVTNFVLKKRRPQGRLAFQTQKAYIMFLQLLKSKIHCATVTEANLHYMGSITIDEDLMDAAGLIAGEQVHVVNNNNGERIVTYVIRGERGSGAICLNGAAARLCQPGDVVIIMAYAALTAEEAKVFQPKVVFPTAKNQLVP